MGPFEGDIRDKTLQHYLIGGVQNPNVGGPHENIDNLINANNQNNLMQSLIDMVYDTFISGHMGGLGDLDTTRFKAPKPQYAGPMAEINPQPIQPIKPYSRNLLQGSEGQITDPRYRKRHSASYNPYPGP
jgi:hypothetical protein